jgi:hypothetical protein
MPADESSEDIHIDMITLQEIDDTRMILSTARTKQFSGKIFRREYFGFSLSVRHVARL